MSQTIKKRLSSLFFIMDKTESLEVPSYIGGLCFSILKHFSYPIGNPLLKVMGC